MQKNPFRRIEMIEGTLDNSVGFTAVTLPTGFNWKNSVVIAFEVDYYDSWRSGVGIASGTYHRTFYRYSTTGLEIYNDDSVLFGQKYRVTLMIL